MKDITQEMQNRVAREESSLCWLVRIERRDGEIKRLNSAGADIVVPGDGTYLGSPGVEVGSITYKADGSPVSVDIELPVDYETEITRDDIRALMYNGALADIYVLDYDEPSVEPIHMFSGYMGGVNYTDGGLCSIAFTGLWAAVANITTWTYGPGCRNRLGDRWCKVPIYPNVIERNRGYQAGDYVRVLTGDVPEGFGNRIFVALNGGVTGASQPTFDYAVDAETVDGDITWKAEEAWIRSAVVTDSISVKSIEIDITESRLEDGWFNDGSMIIYSAATGIKHIYDVQKNVGTIIQAWTPFRIPVAVGDKIEIHPGCNKTTGHCFHKFANIRPGGGLGIQAFPHAPGEDYYWGGYYEENPESPVETTEEEPSE